MRSGRKSDVRSPVAIENVRLRAVGAMLLPALLGSGRILERILCDTFPRCTQGADGEVQRVGSFVGE